MQLRRTVIPLINANYTLIFKKTFRPDYPLSQPLNHLTCIAWSKALLRDQQTQLGPIFIVCV